MTMHADVARRALALIADGLVDRDGVPGLAHRLGYSERQLHRILVAELGAGAISLARTQRAHAAKLLLDCADLSISEIALAAGFGSIRQFNDTMRTVYGTTPTRLRAGRRPASGGRATPEGRRGRGRRRDCCLARLYRARRDRQELRLGDRLREGDRLQGQREELRNLRRGRHPHEDRGLRRRVRLG
jgi:AraC-like DNA-binding protein